jgi:hypothetical protein
MCKSPIPLRVLLFLLAFPLPVLGADTEAPRIIHSAVTTARAGRTLSVTAKILDESEVFEPTLFYRSVGAKKFTSAAMVKSGDAYSASIPDAAMQGEVEYFIEAYDANGNGPSRFASDTAPQMIALEREAPAAVASATTLSTQAPSGEAPAGKTRPSDTQAARSSGDDLRDDDAPLKRSVEATSVETRTEAGKSGPSGATIAGISLASAGAVALGAGAYFGLRSRSLAAAAASDPTAKGAKASLEEAKASATRGNIAMAAGGLLVAAGTVLVLLPSRGAGSGAEEPRALLFVGPGGVLATLQF